MIKMIVLAFVRRIVEDKNHGVAIIAWGTTGTLRVVCLERLDPQFLSNCEPWAFEKLHFSKNFWKTVGYYFYDVLSTKRT
jgi:hypothetical protein